MAQADGSVTWEGETIFVRHGTIVSTAPGSAMYTAYNSVVGLVPLTAAQAGHPEVADKSVLGD